LRTRKNTLLESLMNRLIFFSCLALFLTACNMSPNKEARIQTLEAELVEQTEKVTVLEQRVGTLEEANRQLEVRMLELEK